MSMLTQRNVAEVNVVRKDRDDDEEEDKELRLRNTTSSPPPVGLSTVDNRIHIDWTTKSVVTLTPELSTVRHPLVDAPPATNNKRKMKLLDNVVMLSPPHPSTTQSTNTSKDTCMGSRNNQKGTTCGCGKKCENTRCSSRRNAGKVKKTVTDEANQAKIPGTDDSSHESDTTGTMEQHHDDCTPSEMFTDGCEKEEGNGNGKNEEENSTDNVDRRNDSNVINDKVKDEGSTSKETRINPKKRAHEEEPEGKVSITCRSSSLTEEQGTTTNAPSVTKAPNIHNEKESTTNEGTSIVPMQVSSSMLSSSSKQQDNTKLTTGGRKASSYHKLLQEESKAYLQSHTFTRLHRAREYHPTLEELRSTPFETYVRRVLIGVTGDLPFCEELKEDNDNANKEENDEEEEDSSETSTEEASSTEEEDDESSDDDSSHMKNGIADAMEQNADGVAAENITKENVTTVPDVTMSQTVAADPPQIPSSISLSIHPSSSLSDPKTIKVPQCKEGGNEMTTTKVEAVTSSQVGRGTTTATDVASIPSSSPPPTMNRVRKVRPVPAKLYSCYGDDVSVNITPPPSPPTIITSSAPLPSSPAAETALTVPNITTKKEDNDESPARSLKSDTKVEQVEPPSGSLYMDIVIPSKEVPKNRLTGDNHTTSSSDDSDESSTTDDDDDNDVHDNDEKVKDDDNDEDDSSSSTTESSSSSSSTLSSTSTATSSTTSSAASSHPSPSFSPSQPQKQQQPLLSLDDFLGEPDFHKISDGIAKVTLPDGWWCADHAYGKDTSGRGPAWSKGTPLGDFVIQTPIRQVLSGIGGIYEYTMMELPSMTVSEFRDRADRYRTSQLGTSDNTLGVTADGRSKKRRRLDHGTSISPTPEQSIEATSSGGNSIEKSDNALKPDTSNNDELSYLAKEKDDAYIEELVRQFWRRLGPTMEHAVYGADTVGSLMKDDDACGWNVNHLETCLRLLRADARDGGRKDVDFQLPGVTNSYMYFGMWGSVFAAHTEDMNLFSINYLHAGSPKYWYSIAAEDAPRFESLATHHFNAAFRMCPEFLRHKRYLLSPAILKKAGIPFVTQIQRAGDAMITFPGAYHFGFNTGFNVAESTNFAIPEWVTAGEEANVCLCHPDSVQIDIARFKDLLLRYISYCRDTGSKQKKLSYSDWARLEAKKREEEEAEEAARADIPTISPEVALSEFDKDEFLSSNRGASLRYGDKFIIQLFPPVSTTELKNDNKKKTSNKRRRSRMGGTSTTKLHVASYWFAIKKAPRNFMIGTRVLCYLGCVDKNEFGELLALKRWYAGTVTEVMDGQARLTFDGMTRRDDSWMYLDSHDLYIHGEDASPTDIERCIDKEIKRLKNLIKASTTIPSTTVVASPSKPRRGTRAPKKASPAASSKKAMEITSKMLQAKKAAATKKTNSTTKQGQQKKSVKKASKKNECGKSSNKKEEANVPVKSDISTSLKKEVTAMVKKEVSPKKKETVTKRPRVVIKKRSAAASAVKKEVTAKEENDKDHNTVKEENVVGDEKALSKQAGVAIVAAATTTSPKPVPPKYVVKLLASRLIPETAFFLQNDPEWEELLQNLSQYDLVMLQCLDLSGSMNESLQTSNEGNDETLGQQHNKNKGDVMKLTIRCIHCATYFPIGSCELLAATLKSIRESHFKIDFSSLASNTCCNYLPLREKRQMLKSWPKRNKGEQSLDEEWCRGMLRKHGVSPICLDTSSTCGEFLVTDPSTTTKTPAEESSTLKT